MRFSIITISFNSEKTIERTIKSVLAQTFPDFEYVIVDGASTDGTLDIVKKYEPLFDGRMKWKSEKDKGIYDAMNKGIERSTGDIVGIVNSDDWLESDALAEVEKSYQQNGQSLDVIYTGGMKFHNAKGEMRMFMPNRQQLKLYALIGDIKGIMHPATFVPSNVYKKYGIFNSKMKISADAEFMLRFYNHGGEYILIDKVLTNMSDGGASNTLTLKYIKEVMLPDRRLMMKNLGYSRLRQIFNIFCWLSKMYLKNFLN